MQFMRMYTSLCDIRVYKDLVDAYSHSVREIGVAVHVHARICIKYASANIHMYAYRRTDT
jgi:hypothetical protein